MRPTYVLFTALFFFAMSASAKDRYAVKNRMQVKDLATGQTFAFPEGVGYSYEVIDENTDHARVHFFDQDGMQIVGEFEVTRSVLHEAFKARLTAGLRAADAGVSQPKGVLGCAGCNPQPNRQSAQGEPVRQPAIAPGAKIVYATPLPRVRPGREVVRSEQQIPRAPASSEPLCRAFAAFRAKGVPEAPLRQALYYYSKASREGKISRRSLAIADYSQNSSRKRFYTLDLDSLEVSQEKVSHGRGGGGGRRSRRVASSPADDGRGNLLSCSTRSGDVKTRPGFFRVGDYYFSSNGRYRWPLISRKPPRNGVRLRGLSPGVNESSSNDGVVMHEAKYNLDGNALMGRSHGCPAFVPGKGKRIMDKLEDGGLLYVYAPVCRAHSAKILKQVPGWEAFCR